MTGIVELNREQQDAVSYGNGPLLIIAGAGTGKTTVITERIKHLILNNLAKPSEILALTFTEKAAREMEERVDIALPYGYSQMWIMTFHSFCDRILRNEAIHIGLTSSYKLMTTAESVQFFRKNLFKFDLNYFRPLGNPNKFIGAMLQHFSRLKDEDISPNQYIDWVKFQFSNSNFQKNEINKLKNTQEKKTEQEKWEELAKCYQKYEELKAKEGVFDFGDLISKTLVLFRKRPYILENYRKQFKNILIDEFQDTNIAQYELIKLLAPSKETPNLTVVGDDSQSIYKFRGAAISNILSFMKDYPTSKQIILTQNYRSTQAILDFSYRLIKHNDPDTLEARLGISKNLVSARKIRGTPLELVYTPRVEDEAEEVINLIKTLKYENIKTENKESYQFKDFAILVRANNHAEPFIRALKRAGIPYQFLGPGLLFRQKEIKDLIAYLKVLYSFDDVSAFYRVLTMETWQISGRDLTAVMVFAKKYNLSLFEACELISASLEPNHMPTHRYVLPFISQKTKEKVGQITAMILRHMELIPEKSAGQILYYFLEDSGLLKEMLSYKNLEDEQKVKNISKFFDKLKTYEAEHEDASVSAVVDWIDLSLEMGESPAASDTDWMNNDAVNILTIHSSKGLEFPVVFLVNMTSGRFPTLERREQIPIAEGLIKEILPEGDYHLEEERRLFYVGMTRARDLLYLTAANYYGEGKREKKISPFVTETLGKTVISPPAGGSVNSKDKKENEQLSFLDFKTSQSEERKITIDHQKPTTSYQLPITYLSYSQLETFNLCPLKYKYRYIVKLPSPPSAAASFGQTLHEIMRAFYQELKSGKKVDKDFLISLIAQKWIPLGYSSKIHEEKMKKEAEKMLIGYFEKMFEPSSVPLSLEQIFTVKISPNLKLGGKIDRIDKVGEKIEIIDYKTGKVPTQREIDNSLQMTVYAIAATDQYLLAQNINDVILSFYFFQEQKKVSSQRTIEQIKQVKEEIINKAEEMGASNFSPKIGKHCDFCEFKFICPAWEE